MEHDKNRMMLSHVLFYQVLLVSTVAPFTQGTPSLKSLVYLAWNALLPGLSAYKLSSSRGKTYARLQQYPVVWQQGIRPSFSADQLLHQGARRSWSAHVTGRMSFLPLHFYPVIYSKKTARALNPTTLVRYPAPVTFSSC